MRIFGLVACPLLLAAFICGPQARFGSKGQTAEAVKDFVQQFYAWYVPVALQAADHFQQGWTVAVKERGSAFSRDLKLALTEDQEAQAKVSGYIVGLDFDLFLAAQGAPAMRSLLLLAGTPTNQGPETYPASLYTVGPHQALQLVRVVVPARQGLFGVAYDQGGSVYVAYPHIVPRVVSVIHLRSPSLADDVAFNPESLLTYDYFFAASAAPGQGSRALYPAWAARQPRNKQNSFGGLGRSLP